MEKMLAPIIVPTAIETACQKESFFPSIGFPLRCKIEIMERLIKFAVCLAVTVTILTLQTAFSKEKPVEAWISYKQEGEKVVEVIKVRTDSGKVYEIHPGLSPEEIPKPENKLPEEKENLLFWIFLSFFVGNLMGGIFVWFRMRKV